MPILNSRGEALWGVGGGSGRLQVGLTEGQGPMIELGPEIRAAICARLGIPDSGEGSGWLWKDDDTLIGQFCETFHGPEQCSIWSWHRPTKTLTGPLGPGANFARARGGTAAFWLAGTGTYDTNGYRTPLGAVGDVFENGDVLMVKRRDQDILGMEIVRGASVIQDVPTGLLAPDIFTRGSIALWLDLNDHQLHALGAPAPLNIPNYNHPGAFAADSTGRLWICDGQFGLLLRAWDAPVGRWLSRDERDYRQDIVSRPDGKLRVVSASTEGEASGSERVYDVDPLTGDFTINGQPGQAPLINLQTNDPAELPTIPTKPVVTNIKIENIRVDNRNTSDLLLLIGGLALIAYFVESKPKP